MILSTTHTLEGYRIEQYITIVHGETIIGANFLRDIAAGIRDFIGGRSSSYESVIREAQETAKAEMAQRAHLLRADAVIGVSFSYSAIGSSMLMVTCSGTAVRAR